MAVLASLAGMPGQILWLIVKIQITKDFGIWHSHWYHDIINSTEFSQTTNIIMNVPNEYKKIYKESLSIYEHMNQLSI